MKKKGFLAYITYVIYKPARTDPSGYALDLCCARAQKQVISKKQNII